jgi:outer membrane protein assembly factor BamB
MIGQDGVIKGHFSSWGRVRGAPALAQDGTVYFGDENGYFEAYNSGSGERLWEFHAEGSFTGTAAIDANGNVYIANDYYNCYAFKAALPPVKSSWPMLGHDPHHTGRASGK